MLGIALYQGFDKGGFPDTGRTNNSDNEGRGFFGEAVDERDVETLFANIVRAGGLFLEATGGGECECFGVCACA